MARTFNCGLGMIAVVDAERVDAAAELLRGEGERVHRIGELVPLADGAEQVRIEGLSFA